MRHILQTKILVALVFFMLFFVATPVFAADVFLDAKSQSSTQGEEFLVQVFLNTEEESLNAVEGKLTFPADLLEMRETRDDNSVINFWIEKPYISQSGAIVFAGITPGGFLGQKGLLFSVLFRAKASPVRSRPANPVRNLVSNGAESTATTASGRSASNGASGEGMIQIDEIQVLKNDGEGTPADVKIFNFQFSI